MKKHLQLWIVLVFFSLVLAACQSAPEDAPAQETAEIDTSYPAVEDVPVQNSPDLDAAYPITEEDLDLLFRTWDLSVYLEDGVAQDTKDKTLQFYSDGSYEMITESGTTTGDWSTRLFAVGSTLILNSDSGETLTFDIVELEESKLILQSWQENVQIEEQYQPAD